MGKLVIGAPTSPVLSNALMYDFDQKWSQICTDYQVTYTRYADDIYMSTKLRDVLSPLLVSLKADLVEMPGFNFSINTEKDVFTSGEG
jgi:RNA-directed DNA polymerase